jgi:hypothetical protein
MQDTIILTIQRRLPALFVQTIYLLALLFFVLPEIKTLSWEHFGSNTALEILVGNQTISIKIKLLENFFKDILLNVHAPEIEVKSELFFRNFSGFFYVKVHERFSESFPLKFDFF